MKSAVPLLTPCVVFSCRLLADVVMQFPVWQDEVTLSVTPHGVGLRSYCEEGRGESMPHRDSATVEGYGPV